MISHVAITTYFEPFTTDMQHPLQKHAPDTQIYMIMQITIIYADKQINYDL